MIDRRRLPRALYCRCGERIKLSLASGELRPAEELDEWRKLHSGEGHREITSQGAAELAKRAREMARRQQTRIPDPPTPAPGPRAVDWTTCPDCREVGSYYSHVCRVAAPRKGNKAA